MNEEFDLFGDVDGFVRGKVAPRQFVPNSIDDGQGLGVESLRFAVVADGHELVPIGRRSFDADARGSRPSRRRRRRRVALGRGAVPFGGAARLRRGRRFFGLTEEEEGEGGGRNEKRSRRITDVISFSGKFGFFFLFRYYFVT